LPTLDATTTAVFASIGINPSTVYSVFTALVSTTVSFLLWLVQVTWPFLLGILLILALWRIIHYYRGTARQ